MLTVWLVLGLAQAHGRDEPAPGGWIDRVMDQPLAVANLLALVSLYGVGWWRLWKRAPRRRRALRRGALAMAGGLLTVGIALFSPLDAHADRLAWVHMLQHLLLMMVAAPLIVLASPLQVVAPWGLPRTLQASVGAVRRALGRVRYVLWQPVATWSLYALTVWIWHVPALYEGALRSPLVHDLQHLAFVIAAALFWRVVLDPISRRRLGPGLGLLYLFATSLQAMGLGVLMTFARRAWYPAYGEPPGLTLLEDQQMAGALMWMPGCALYAVVAGGIAARWLAEPPSAVGAPKSESAAAPEVGSP